MKRYRIYIYFSVIFVLILVLFVIPQYYFCYNKKENIKEIWASSVLTNNSTKEDILKAIDILKTNISGLQYNYSYNITLENTIARLISIGAIDKNFNILNISKIRSYNEEELQTIVRDVDYCLFDDYWSYPAKSLIEFSSEALKNKKQLKKWEGMNMSSSCLLRKSDNVKDKKKSIELLKNIVKLKGKYYNTALNALNILVDKDALNKDFSMKNIRKIKIYDMPEKYIPKLNFK